MACRLFDPTATRTAGSIIPLEQTIVRLAAVWLVMCIILAFTLFALFPQADLLVSAMFHRLGAGFPAEADVRFQILRASIWGSSQVMVALAMVGLAVNTLRGQATLDIPSRVWGFILCLYALGPGVLVELVTKPLWSRARPASTLAFGGNQPYSLPTEFVDYCSRNCSFVSGEVSGATALALSLILVIVCLSDRFSPLMRKMAVVSALNLPIASALQRIAAGRHFLSDAVLAILFTLLLALGLAVALRLQRLPHGKS